MRVVPAATVQFQAAVFFVAALCALLVINTKYLVSRDMFCKYCDGGRRPCTEKKSRIGSGYGMLQPTTTGVVHAPKPSPEMWSFMSLSDRV